jgi:hypothetical protein
MATQTLIQVFSSLLNENIYRDNEFMLQSVDHSAFINGSIVHVPNAGVKPTVVKNRSTFPATAAERDDIDLTYAISNLSVTPVRIRNAVEFQTNYSIQNSVVTNARNALAESMAEELLYSWVSTITRNDDGTPAAIALPAGQILPTSGAAGTNNAPDGVGDNKQMALTEIKLSAKILDNQDVAKSGRYAVLPVEMYYELIDDAKITDASAFGTGEAPLATGAVRRLWGIDIFVRSAVNIYDAAGVLQAAGSTPTTGDLHGAVVWQKDYVTRADGMNNVYVNSGNGNGDALQYGHVVSSEKMFGGTRLREDNKGVVAIVQEINV